MRCLPPTQLLASSCHSRPLLLLARPTVPMLLDRRHCFVPMAAAQTQIEKGESGCGEYLPHMTARRSPAPLVARHRPIGRRGRGLAGEGERWEWPPGAHMETGRETRELWAEPFRVVPPIWRNDRMTDLG